MRQQQFETNQMDQLHLDPFLAEQDPILFYLPKQLKLQQLKQELVMPKSSGYQKL